MTPPPIQYFIKLSNVARQKPLWAVFAKPATIYSLSQILLSRFYSTEPDISKEGEMCRQLVTPCFGHNWYLHA